MQVNKPDQNLTTPVTPLPKVKVKLSSIPVSESLGVDLSERKFKVLTNIEFFKRLVRAFGDEELIKSASELPEKYQDFFGRYYLCKRKEFEENEIPVTLEITKSRVSLFLKLDQSYLDDLIQKLDGWKLQFAYKVLNDLVKDRKSDIFFEIADRLERFEDKEIIMKRFVESNLFVWDIIENLDESNVKELVKIFQDKDAAFNFIQMSSTTVNLPRHLLKLKWEAEFLCSFVKSPIIWTCFSNNPKYVKVEEIGGNYKEVTLLKSVNIFNLTHNPEILKRMLPMVTEANVGAFIQAGMYLTPFMDRFISILEGNPKLTSAALEILEQASSLKEFNFINYLDMISSPKWNEDYFAKWKLFVEKLPVHTPTFITLFLTSPSFDTILDRATIPLFDCIQILKETKSIELLIKCDSVFIEKLHAIVLEEKDPGLLLKEMISLYEKDTGFAKKLIMSDVEIFEFVVFVGGDLDRLKFLLEWAENDPVTASRLLHHLKHLVYSDKKDFHLRLYNGIKLHPNEIRKIFKFQKIPAICFHELLVRLLPKSEKKSDEDEIASDSRLTNLFEEVLNAEGISERDIGLLGILIVHDHRVFVKKLLSLFKRDPELARTVLVYAVEGNQARAGEKALALLERGKITTVALKKPESSAKVEEASAVVDFKEIQKRIDEFEKSYKTTAFNDDEYILARSTYITQLIAELVITDPGLIPKIKEHLLTHETSFDKHITWILDSFYKFKDALKVIKEPTSEKGKFIVRATLGLSHDFPLEPKHAQMTILGALLAHIRQGSVVGSCAGTSRAITIKHDLNKALELFSNILAECKIKKIEIQPNLNSHILNNVIVFQLDGSIRNIEGTVFVWDMPGIQRMGKYLGISDIKQWVLETLKSPEFAEHINFLNYSSKRRNLLEALIAKAGGSKEQAIISYLCGSQVLLVRALEAAIITADNMEETEIKKSLFKPFEQNLMVNPEGILAKSNYLKMGLWRAEPFRKACIALGITSGQEIQQVLSTTVKRIIQEADNARAPLRPISLRQFLEALIKTANKKKITQDQVQEAFLKVAPQLDLDKIKLNFVRYRAKDKDELNPANFLFFPHPVLGDLLNMSGTAEFREFTSLFKKEIESRVKVIYDHDYGAGAESDSQGQKVLVDWGNDAKKITSFEDFKSFSKELVSSVLQKMNADEPFKSQCIAFVESPIFQEIVIRDFLGKYIDAFVGNKPSSFEHVYEKPWNLGSGARGRSTWVFSTFNEGDKNLAIHQIYPKRGIDVLRYIIQTGNVLGGRQDLNVWTSGIIPGHAISFMFGHPSLQPLWNNDDPWKWIHETVEVPAQEIGSAEADKEYQQKVFEELKENPFEFTGSYKEFRQALVTAIAAKRGSYIGLEPMEAKIDTVLMKYLPEKGYVMHIADSNWLNKTDQQDIHFCLLYSPFSNQFELWNVDQNGSNLRKRLKSEWFHSKLWEVYREL